MWHCVGTYTGINIGEACAAWIVRVNSEYWGSMFLRNIGTYLPNCIASRPVRPWLWLVIHFVFSITVIQWDYLRLFIHMTVKLLKKWMAECVDDDWESVSDLNPTYNNKFKMTPVCWKKSFYMPQNKLHCLGGKILELHKIVSPLLTSQHLLIIISSSFLKRGYMKYWSVHNILPIWKIITAGQWVCRAT
jgi:hypothetical protein